MAIKPLFHEMPTQLYGQHSCEICGKKPARFVGFYFGHDTVRGKVLCKAHEDDPFGTKELAARARIAAVDGE